MPSTWMRPRRRRGAAGPRPVGRRVLLGLAHEADGARALSYIGGGGSAHLDELLDMDLSMVHEQRHCKTSQTAWHQALVRPAPGQPPSRPSAWPLNSWSSRLRGRPRVGRGPEAWYATTVFDLACGSPMTDTG